jgi:hypothetical protein
LTQPEAEDDGILERVRRLIHLRVLASEALVPVRRFVVDGDCLVVAANLVHGLSRQIGLVEAVVRVDEHATDGDRLRDQATRLVGASGVVEDLVRTLTCRALGARGLAVLLPQAEVCVASLGVESERVGPAAIGGLDHLLCPQPLDVALDA